MWSRESGSELRGPNEIDFCLRECLATNPDDLDAVYDLITHWGRLTPPESQLRVPLNALPASLDRLIPTLTDAALRRPLWSSCVRQSGVRPTGGRVAARAVTATA